MKYIKKKQPQPDAGDFRWRIQFSYMYFRWKCVKSNPVKIKMTIQILKTVEPLSHHENDLQVDSHAGQAEIYNMCFVVFIFIFSSSSLETGWVTVLKMFMSWYCTHCQAKSWHIISITFVYTEYWDHLEEARATFLVMLKQPHNNRWDRNNNRKPASSRPQHQTQHLMLNRSTRETNPKEKVCNGEHSWANEFV